MSTGRAPAIDGVGAEFGAASVAKVQTIGVVGAGVVSQPFAPGADLALFVPEEAVALPFGRAPTPSLNGIHIDSPIYLEVTPGARVAVLPYEFWRNHRRAENDLAAAHHRR